MKTQALPYALTVSLLLAAGGWAVPSLRAAELGERAPDLKIAEWVKGSPVDLAKTEGKQVVVVEFWATWCPPCRASIPHLTELQKKFKDKGVVFVGISDERPAVVKRFVKDMGEKMDYVVAIDDNRQTSAGYMQAFNQNGIPHAFIVDKQRRIVWHGHPMGDLEKTLDEIVAGTFDLAKAKKRIGAQDMLQEYYELVSRGGDAQRIAELEKKLLALDKELGGIQKGQKFDPQAIKQRLEFSKHMQAYQRAMMSNADQAELDRLEKAARAAAPKDFDFDEYVKAMKFQTIFIRYMRAVTRGGSKDEIARLARQLSNPPSRDPELLNTVAWTILTDEDIKDRDVALALKIAKMAHDESKGKSADILDTYAKALFENGQVQEAIRQQRKALELATGEDMKGQLKERLEQYEKAAREKK